jgi:hypothetical protein
MPVPLIIPVAVITALVAIILLTIGPYVRPETVKPAKPVKAFSGFVNLVQAGNAESSPAPSPAQDSFNGSSIANKMLDSKASFPSPAESYSSSVAVPSG